MWNSQRTLGSLAVALLWGASSAFAGDLTNVTLGRFQDFTVVTLFGDGPMTVTHQIVEAKDGKPHRIVVDVTGALHKLPQNNFSDLPEGSITTIRTSQFAVSPESVVRVVLDLAHPAAYRLETPENQVRVMVSLPGDPPLPRVWSARGGMNDEPSESPVILADAGQPQDAPGADLSASESQVTSADTEPAAEAVSAAATAESTGVPSDPPTGTTESHSEPSLPAEEQPAPAWNNPAKSTEPDGEIKSLPVAAAGALALSGNEASTDAAQTEAASMETPETVAATGTDEPVSDEAAALADASVSSEASPAGSEPVATPEATPAAVASADLASSADQVQPAENTAAEETAQDSHEAAVEPESGAFAREDLSDAPQVPMPEGSIEQPERVIDYNLPIPAALAGGATASDSDQESNSPSNAEVTGEPKLAVKSGDAETASANPTGSDAAVTDLGSAPVASLSTLPPLSESAADLVPQRTQVIYHTQGRRDPFKPLLQSGGYNAAALPDVSALRLVGLLHDVQESWGLFEDANGYGYILRKGDRVKNGSLTQLTNNRAYFSLTEFGWSRSVHIDLEPEG